MLADFAGVTFGILLSLVAIKRAEKQGGFDIDFSLTDGVAALARSVKNKTILA